MNVGAAHVVPLLDCRPYAEERAAEPCKQGELVAMFTAFGGELAHNLAEADAELVLVPA